MTSLAPGACERLIDWFDGQRLDHLVGRADELARIDGWLADEAVRVVFVQGVAGVGKTALALAAAQRLRARGERVLWLSPERSAGGATDPADVSVVVIDSLERFAEPHAVLDEVLRSVAASARIVVCAQGPLPRSLVADPAFLRATRRLALTSLSAAATVELSRALGRPASDPRALMARTQGNPLLVVLDAPDGDGPVSIQAAVHALFADSSNDETEALYAFAMLRQVTAPLLAATLDKAPMRATELFRRTCRVIPVVTSGAGVRLPDALREALMVELERHAPESRVALARRAQEALLKRLDGALSDDLLAETVRDIGFACRFEPFSMVLGLGPDLPTEEVTPTPGELARFLSTVARLDGPTHAALARGWLETEHATVVAIRRPLQVARAAVLFLELDPTRAQPIADPVVDALLQRVNRDMAPLAPGERLGFARCWLDFEDHQDVHSRHVRDVSRLLQKRFLATGRSLFAAAHHAVEPWLAQGFRPLPLLTVAEVDGHRTAVFGDDRRKTTASRLHRRWVEAARMGTTSRGDVPDWSDTPQHPVLAARPPLLAQLRSALRAFHRESTLARSELHHLACVRARPEASPTDALRALLRHLTETLGDAGHDGVLSDVLRATYFEQPKKGLAVAADLGLGYSTYRRWLGRAVRRLAEVLEAHEASRVWPAG